MIGPAETMTLRLEAPHPSHWVDPGTDCMYPLAYGAYRRAREAEERSPARHRRFGPEIDKYLWQHARSLSATDIEVLFTVRRDTPPRIRRIIAEVLRAIRQGESAPDAIGHISRRFRLRRMRARALIASCIGFEIQSTQDAPRGFR